MSSPQRPKSFRWYLRLRWFSFLAQTTVLVLAIVPFHLTLPVKWILLTLFLTPISNILIRTRFITKEISGRLIGATLVLDTVVLTILLALSGGATNPFSIVYLLHVVLAAVMLGRDWTWGIATLTTLCFGALFLFTIPVPEWQHHSMQSGLSLHLQGMLLSYLAVSFLSAYFLTKIIEELRSREKELERLKNLSARHAQLTAMTSLAAGTAHELGSPLGTIAIVAHELRKTLQGVISPDTLADLSLLTAETERCKEILAAFAESSGSLIGEAPTLVTPAEIIEEAVSRISVGNFEISLEGKLESVSIVAPKRALMNIINGLVRNGIDAAKLGQMARVAIAFEARSACACFRIADNGMGIPDDVLPRLGEPFFSTKTAGKGMGLGIYLAKLTLEQLGGSIQFEPNPGGGTAVSLEIPNCVLVNQSLGAAA